MCVLVVKICVLSVLMCVLAVKMCILDVVMFVLVVVMCVLAVVMFALVVECVFWMEITRYCSVVTVTLNLGQAVVMCVLAVVMCVLAVVMCVLDGDNTLLKCCDCDSKSGPSCGNVCFSCGNVCPSCGNVCSRWR